MLARRTALALLAAARVLPAEGFICPMDKDVKSAIAGKCPRCGMKLVANLPEPVEYRLDLRLTPSAPRVGQPALLEFKVRHPNTGQPVREFELMHERLLHIFRISADLEDFAHEHPSPRPDGSFALPIRFARAVPYRVAADFYPKGGTPQFLAKTIFPAGAPLVLPPSLSADRAAKTAANLTVELTTEPAEPVAGEETLLFFRLSPKAGVEQYLGAWGHLLMASDDLVDLAHDHPLYVDGVPPPDLRAVSPGQVQFNLIFPRKRTYRVWVQFQRAGRVNTAAFTIPVKALR